MGKKHIKEIYYYNSPIGNIGIASDNNKITNIFFDNVNKPNNTTLNETPLIHEAYKQICEYFNGTRKNFNLPLSFEGTGFQCKVWQALQTIPYGETRTYKQIAEQIGNPQACRAVGLANNRNPICIVIPCHRVIGANGNLTGYAGGIHIKKFLLHTESKYI